MNLLVTTLFVWWGKVLPRSLLFMACLLFAGLSFAHTALQSSSPPDQAILSDSPASIFLHFNKLANLIKLSVTDSNGTEINTEFVIAKNRASDFTIPVVDVLRNGAYSVRWVIIGADGHKVDGEFGFVLSSGK